MVVPIGEENMTRKEMLDILHGVEFELIDPPSSWKDIGFTEREIWVYYHWKRTRLCLDRSVVFA